jgi:rare lipoprotein A
MQTTGFSAASRLALVVLAGASLAACATVQPKYATRGGSAAAPAPGGYKVGQPYQVAGIWYVPKEQPNYDETGIASWYGDAFQMKPTANGETFDMNQFSAAHTTLPLPSIVEVTNLDNGKTLRVRVNDRGPFVDNRIIDLSRAAAQELGYDRKGLARVRVKYIGPAPLAGPEAGVRYAEAKPAPNAAVVAASDMPIAVAPAESVQVATLAPPAPVKAASLPPLTGADLDAPATASLPHPGRLLQRSGQRATRRRPARLDRNRGDRARATRRPHALPRHPAWSHGRGGGLRPA